MSAPWPKLLDRAIDDRFGRMVEVRRHLHMHPEPSGCEEQTTRYLWRLLEEQRLDVRLGFDGRGVIADGFGRPGEDTSNRIALRADIDALRIQDQKQVEYCSSVPAVMHACGHDAHCAMVLGALWALGDLARGDKLPWPVAVRGIFQPAEETCEGAKQMIEIGALESVSAIVAAHVDPTRPVGHIGLREGVLTANCDTMRIRITGRGGHAARPHETVDPIAAAAQLINAIYLFIPRVTDSQDALVVTIGQISGGDNPNVIPERVELHGTLRTLSNRVRKHAVKHIRQLAHGTGEMSHTKIDVQFHLALGSVVNKSKMTKLVRRAGLDALGPECLDEIPRPSMGAEDFAYYLDHVEGMMVRVGCASAAAGHSPLHTPLFDVDEEALRIGARVLARTAVLWADPEREASRDLEQSTSGRAE